MILKEKMIKQGRTLYKHRARFNIALLISILYFYLRRNNNLDSLVNTSLVFQYIYDYVLLLLSLLGLGIRTYAKGYSVQRFYMPKSTGLYSLMRHPIYISTYLIWLGMVGLSYNLGYVLVFTLVYLLYYERIMLAEEELLIEKYSKAYYDYAEKTPAITPRPKSYSKQKQGFSWSKVVDMELNYLLLIAVTFTMLNILGNILQGVYKFNIGLLAFGAIVLIFYLVITIKKELK